MIDLVLDTNIWINHIAMDNPTGIFNELKYQIESEQVFILANEIIIDEWNRNKATTTKTIIKRIKDQSKNALEIKEFLDIDDKTSLEKILSKYAQKENEREELAIKRIEDVEHMILNGTQTKITNEMKLKVVDWALKKRAPFKVKNNSVGDALILLSSAEHRKTTNSPKGFFVSFNHTDYADPTDKDIIDEDLQDLLEDSNMEYKRNIGEVLHLTPELNMEIERYIDMLMERAKDERRGI